ncbi:MAG: GMP synthase (glutamine-hydrolyzing) subunit A [Methanosaeta sp. PtaB.Bin039]|nr:MAG: GMP synthase (glutamine-hydrolyzing) subunit A [Methanosaeta sp. PtaB.Bin039]OPY47757.1 MAG: GMP synthase (glutamine-hydrolyzing) subunit A [Methanosaeta sp. PtaU1.Bin028]HOT07735.1 type 1 glutamine amidotransferase [Methanotrichaceae archaeon]HQF17409.1 type 1 glutamine amidotransferase [Methanotrichaceae archaeon]HQI92167.1 type 1 glutamine amidotransferase [Methanotrichaceae archaeon]
MRLHYLQHVPFEDLANIEVWAKDRGHSLSKTLLFNGEPVPGLDKFDWLVVMGGPMSIYEEEKFPWLAHEKRFIRRSIESGKIVLGVCLGAQLIADILGGRVRRNEHREIGWHRVSLTSDGLRSRIFGVLPEHFTAFHWHGDTFDIPPAAARMAESRACLNQAFEVGKSIGLQFHLESSMSSINSLIENCREELAGGEFVQLPEEITGCKRYIIETNGLMEKLMDRIEDCFWN